MNQTIYFRKDVWAKFSLEDKKSELINHLLELHYEADIVKPGSFKAYDNGDVGYTVNPAPKPIKTKQEAQTAVKQLKKPLPVTTKITNNWGA